MPNAHCGPSRRAQGCRQGHKVSARSGLCSYRCRINSLALLATSSGNSMSLWSHPFWHWRTLSKIGFHEFLLLCGYRLDYGLPPRRIGVTPLLLLITCLRTGWYPPLCRDELWVSRHESASPARADSSLFISRVTVTAQDLIGHLLDIQCAPWQSLLLISLYCHQSTLPAPQ